MRVDLTNFLWVTVNFLSFHAVLLRIFSRQINLQQHSLVIRCVDLTKILRKMWYKIQYIILVIIFHNVYVL